MRRKAAGRSGGEARRERWATSPTAGKRSVPPALPFISKLLTNPSPSSRSRPRARRRLSAIPAGRRKRRCCRWHGRRIIRSSSTRSRCSGSCRTSPWSTACCASCSTRSRRWFASGYRVLARNHDPSVYSKVITEDPNNQKFILDIVPSQAAADHLRDPQRRAADRGHRARRRRISQPCTSRRWTTG